MSNLSVSKVPRKTKNNPQPTLSENFNSHPLFNKDQLTHICQLNVSCGQDSVSGIVHFY
jgi:hypothetical protein